MSPPNFHSQQFNSTYSRNSSKNTSVKPNQPSNGRSILFKQTDSVTFPSNTLDKYSRKKKEINKTQKYSNNSAGSDGVHMKKANTQKQFKKYLTDTHNVFYEDRKQAKILKFLQTIMPLSFKILGILIAIAAILSFIQPFKGNCPVNADCGVYIHCHRGFILKENRCLISQQARNQAQQLCLASIQNLQIQFGNKQCQSECANPNIPPNKQIFKIISQFEVDSRATESEMYVWFQNQTNQKLYGFTYNQQGLKPTKKQYSFNCLMKLTVNSEYFPICLVTFIIMAGIIVTVVEHMLLNQKANKVYEYLYKQVQESDDKRTIIDYTQIYNKLGIKISERLWSRVDNLRCKNQQIVYFQDDKLHWIKLS